MVNKDGTGVIPTKDLGSLLHTIGMNLTDRELQDLCSELAQRDAEGNGVINFTLFLCIMGRV